MKRNEEEKRAKQAFHDQIQRDERFRRHVLGPLQRHIAAQESILRNTGSTERQIFTAQGSLEALMLVERLLKGSPERVLKEVNVRHTGTGYVVSRGDPDYDHDG